MVDVNWSVEGICILMYEDVIGWVCIGDGVGGVGCCWWWWFGVLLSMM